MAKAAAAMQVLRAVEPQASSTTKTTISAVQSGGTSTQAPVPVPNGPPNGSQAQPLPQQAPNGQGDVQIEQILKIFREGVVGKCSKCHGQSDPKGGFMIASYPNLDRVKQTKVIARLFHDNPEKHMPPASEPQLTTEETLTFIALRKP
jgi:mono/diheme cytochrome c family protein